MAPKVPRPGTPVRGSTTGRPLLAAMDLLGRRWTLRILWELRDGALGSRALRDRCDQMSMSVLYARLADLTESGLVRQDAAGAYELTQVGAALNLALRPLDAWARRWTADLLE
ncbi:MAG: HxlR family transcriptional regulator [Marmoricola sp.]|nr:HxlR family transcriptional regulator [Marmoricola sp.]